MESKYVMAIIKMPVEIFKNGKTITHEDKCVIDYEPISELPTTQNNNNKLDLSKLFSSEDNNDFKFKTFVEDEDDDDDHDDEDDDEDDENDDEHGNTTIPSLENKIYIKSEELIKKKSRSKNSTFKNKKFNRKQLTRKMYPPMVDNVQDVDLAQSQEDQESPLEDD
jgi:hypothetical protein